jgi:UDP-N-acetylglucosamine--N-acetylmuramyl-(pentapeptide) pyrophosphoryl-undecaprenol N-acetylglucosamine transferase
MKWNRLLRRRRSHQPGGRALLAELCLYGKPSILIPLPTAAGNHQEANAEHGTKRRFDTCLQNELTTKRLETELISLITDETRADHAAKALTLAKPESARLIIDDILKYLEEHAA